jgi:hypothetical protein
MGRVGASGFEALTTGSLGERRLDLTSTGGCDHGSATGGWSLGRE